MPLDEYITFYPVDQAGVPAPTTAPTPEEAVEAAREASEDPVVLAVTDVALTVANLDAAERMPLSVPPNASISEAMTLMELHHYSQLVVQTGIRSVKGTASYKSIARRLLTGEAGDVQQCLDEPVPRVTLETPLLEVVGHFRAHGAVLVFDRGAICGIVTPADISEEFGGLAEPFLLIGEIENLLRWLLAKQGVDIEAGLQKSAVVSVESNTPAVPEDLTLGQMQRLLEHEETWGALGVKYHRKTICGALDTVRQHRNSVMHFREPLDPSQMQELRNFQTMVKSMCESIS